MHSNNYGHNTTNVADSPFVWVVGIGDAAEPNARGHLRRLKVVTLPSKNPSGEQLAPCDAVRVCCSR